jgi:hypothetical protein
MIVKGCVVTDAEALVQLGFSPHKTAVRALHRLLKRLA